MRKRSIIDLVIVKLLFDIVVLIIVMILMFYAITAVANLAIFEDRKYISLVNTIEKAMDSCIKMAQCEEVIWMEDFNYNPITYSLYFNYTEGRIYLIKCDEPEGKIYFEADGEDLYRVYTQNCRVIKRTKPILTPDTKIIIESENNNINIYTLKIALERVAFATSNDLYRFDGNIGGIRSSYRDTCVIRIKETNTLFEINKDSVRKDLGSFLFGEASKTKTGLFIKETFQSTCSNTIYEISSKEDLSEKGILVSPPMQVYIDPSNRIIKFIIPKEQ